MALVRATTTVHLPGFVTVNQGDLLEDDDPAVRKYPAFFVSAAATRSTPVVDATAKPGAKRGRGSTPVED